MQDLEPVTPLKTECGEGFGLAACPVLGLMVTSDVCKNTLSVWRLPSGGAGGGGLALVCTLGGEGSPPPMQFEFEDDDGYSGYLAFVTPPTTAGTSSSGAPAPAPLLLVTDAGNDAVHMVDVTRRVHAGYLAAPGSIAGPRGVAVSGASPLVAISAWKESDTGDHVVHVYAGSGSGWEAVRVIGGGFGGPGAADGQLDVPYGLRFSADGSAVCVADWWNDRVSVFRVGDGGFVRHIATGLSRPYDVEAVDGGWVVACGVSHTVEFVGGGGGGGGRPSLGKAGGEWGSGDGEFIYPVALALVPGLGLVVREFSNGGRLQVFSTPDMIAMRRMSVIRVAWMSAAVRAPRRMWSWL